MKRHLKLRVNKISYDLDVEPTMTLAKVLREELGLKGTKENCNVGRCGACTVLLNGRAVYSCLTLAVQTEGMEIQTIEGLSSGNKLHPLQTSFIENGAFQCGFCTPGMLMMAKSLLDENPNPSEDDVRKGMSGNLCRCTGYAPIIRAILKASEKMRR
jgi:carbon-monoxide dehydrogenase small subunit